MNTKSKIALSISIIFIVLSVAILTIAAVWAATQQNFESSFNVNYTAMQVSGSATAQWKVGSGSWYDMTTNGSTSGATTVTFGAQVNENAALKPTSNYIELSPENQYVIFKYKFTNTGENDYAIDLFYTDNATPDANMSVLTYNAETELTSDYQNSITTNFGNWTTTSISAGKTRYIYILASIIDITNSASFSGSFSFTLDGINYEDVVKFSNGTITGLNKDVSVLRIPSQVGTQAVTTIAAGAFANKTSLKEVIIPDSVATIGGAAFTGCSNLKYLQISFVGGDKNASSVSASTLFGYIFGTTSYSGGHGIRQFYDRSRGYYAIYYIPTSLTNVITEGTSIGTNAFQDCIELTSVTILEGVTSIGEGAFSGCSGLTSITIPESVISIEQQAFVNCSGLTSITIPSGVEGMGGGAFSNCSGLKEVIIESKIICSYGFIGSANLTAPRIKAKYEITALTSYGYTSQGKQGDYYIYTKNA